MNNKFASLWPKTTTRLQAGIAIFATIGTAAALATGVWGFAAGAIGMWQMVAAGGLAIAAHGIVNAVAHSGQGGQFIREIGRPAPQDMQQIAEDLFAKAGLEYRPQVYLTDSKREQKPGPLGRLLNFIFARDRHVLYDNSAFVLPIPSGPRRDTIMIGVGHKLAPHLTRSEFTAVLAHEAGHLVHQSPGHRPLYSTASKLAAGLMVTSALFFNFAALPLTVGGYAATRFLMARAGKYDEERADRTSAYLHPDPVALTSALNKVKELIRSELCPNGPTFDYYRRRVKGFLFGAHPQVGTRLRYLEKYTQESVAFHEAHQLPAAIESYSTGERHVMVRGNLLPANDPLVRALKSDWDKKDKAPNDNEKPQNPLRRPRDNGPQGPA